MISLKFAVLMAAMTLVGAGAPLMAAAQHSADTEVELNDEIEQKIEQSQEGLSDDVIETVKHLVISDPVTD
jgi:hypothetical protein